MRFKRSRAVYDTGRGTTATWKCAHRECAGGPRSRPAGGPPALQAGAAAIEEALEDQDGGEAVYDFPAAADAHF